MKITLTEDEILALYTLSNMDPEEASVIEDYAEVIAQKTGIAVVDAAVLLMNMGQHMATNPGVIDERR
jgi:hypothetical protein